MDKWLVNKSNVHKWPIASTSVSSEVSSKFLQLNKRKILSRYKKANEKKSKKQKTWWILHTIWLHIDGNCNEPNP